MVDEHALVGLTRKTYDRLGAFNSSAFCKRFGSWSRACDLAGVATGAHPAKGHDDDAWMKNIFDVWLTLGRQSTYGEMACDRSRFGPTGYSRRYGFWSSALLRFQQWVDAQDVPEDLV